MLENTTGEEFVELRDMTDAPDRGERGGSMTSVSGQTRQSHSSRSGSVASRLDAAVDPTFNEGSEVTLWAPYRLLLSSVGLLPVDGSRHSVLWTMNWAWRLTLWGSMIAYAFLPPREEGIFQGRWDQERDEGLFRRTLSTVPLIHVFSYPLVVAVLGTERMSLLDKTRVRRGGFLHDKLSRLSRNLHPHTVKQSISTATVVSVVLAVLHLLFYAFALTTGFGLRSTGPALVVLGLFSSFFAQQCLIIGMIQIVVVLHAHGVTLARFSERVGPAAPFSQFDLADDSDAHDGDSTFLGGHAPDFYNNTNNDNNNGNNNVDNNVDNGNGSGGTGSSHEIHGDDGSGVSDREPFRSDDRIGPRGRFSRATAVAILEELRVLRNSLVDTGNHLWWTLSMAVAILVLLLTVSIAAFFTERDLESAANVFVVLVPLLVILITPASVTSRCWDLSSRCSELKCGPHELEAHAALVKAVGRMCPGYVVLGITISFDIIIRVATILSTITPVVIAAKDSI